MITHLNIILNSIQLNYGQYLSAIVDGILFFKHIDVFMVKHWINTISMGLRKVGKLHLRIKVEVINYASAIWWFTVDYSYLFYVQPTCLMAMDVARPGLTVTPSSSGKGILSREWTTTRTPTVSLPLSGYSFWFTFSTMCNPWNVDDFACDIQTHTHKT